VKTGALVLLCMLLVAPATRADESPADVATARELFFEANRLGAEGRWEEARIRFARSLALKRSAVTIYSLGVAQLHTGQLVEALESFRAFLREPQSEASDPYRAPATQSMAELEKRVARVTISVRPANAPALRARIDGHAVPSAALGGPRLINPGEHVVTLEARGYRTAERRFEVAEGASERVEVTLAAKPQPATSELAPPEPSATTTTPVPVAGIVLLAVGAAAIGVGIGVGVAGANQADAAPTRDGSEAAQARRMGIAADVLFGVGGATVGVGLVFLFIDLFSEPAENTAALRFGL
jgi:hypothetical protein